jgi:hypothetical protein
MRPIINKSLKLLCRIKKVVYTKFKKRTNFNKLILIYFNYIKYIRPYKLVSLYTLILRKRVKINKRYILSTNVVVYNYTDLNHYCRNATAGDTITLAPNTIFDGNLIISGTNGEGIKGTPDNYIRILGDNTSTIKGAAGIDTSYAIKIINSSYIYFGIVNTNLQYGNGFNLTLANKGFYADNCNNITVQNLNIYNIGNEGIHFLNRSSNCNIYNNVVFQTGMGTDPDSKGYGEGIYIGSASNKWEDNYIDDTNNINIFNNNLFDTYAECIDIKEGTHDGLIKGNTFGGKNLNNYNYADSWVNVKGTKWKICNNEGTITYANGSGMQTQYIETKYPSINSGSYNIFCGNILNCYCDSYAIYINTNNTIGNIVYSNNIASNANNGLTNIPVDENTPPPC